MLNVGILVILLWVCGRMVMFFFFADDIFLYVLIAELSDSFHATLLWVTNTLTHTLFPLLNQLPFLLLHTHTAPRSIMLHYVTPSNRSWKNISFPRPSCAALPLRAFLFFSPRCLAPFGSLSPVCLSFPLSLSLIPRSCETMSCNNTELNLCVKAVFPLHWAHTHKHTTYTFTGLSLRFLKRH